MPTCRRSRRTCAWKHKKRRTNSQSFTDTDHKSLMWLINILILILIIKHRLDSQDTKWKYKMTSRLDTDTRTHKHTHTQRERERQTDRERCTPHNPTPQCTSLSNIAYLFTCSLSYSKQIHCTDITMAIWQYQIAVFSISNRIDGGKICLLYLAVVTISGRLK